MKHNPFIEQIKEGKRVKAGSQWLRTHRGLPVCREPLPPAYLARLNEILHFLASAEKAKPSPPGQSFEIPISGKASIGRTYKWLGKDAEEKRIGIAGVMIDGEHHLSVEMGSAPAVYFHRQDQIFKLEVPPDLKLSFAEVLSRTPGKYIGEETVQPSSGVIELEAFKKVSCVIGCDESNRGGVAGSLIGSAVFLTPDSNLPPVYDSKQLDREARKRVFEEIQQSGVPFAFSVVDVETIYRIGITRATALAFDLAIKECEAKAGRPAELLVLDGGKLPLSAPQPKQFVTKGESVSRAIAAASVIATAVHEQLMMELHAKYPEWEFDKNMGYAQPGHLRALEVHGFCPAHRKSFNPIKQMVEAQLASSRSSDQLTIGFS